MKYFTVYKNALSTFFQYRINLGLFALGNLISLSGLVYLWLAVYSSGQSLGGYTQEGIIVYYVVIIALRSVIAEGVGMAFRISAEMNEGLITNYLLKPFSYTLEQFYKLLGQATINAIFIFPALFLIGYISKDVIDLPGLQNIIHFLGLSFIALLFYFLIYFFGSLATFWLTDGRSAVYALLIASNFLNGSIIPLDIFPLWGQKIVNLLPFRYLLFVPIQAFLGRIENYQQLFVGQLIWAIILIALIYIVWQRGIRRYEAVGR